MPSRSRIAQTTPPATAGETLDRRRFLQFVGFGAVSLACSKSGLPLVAVDGEPLPWFHGDGTAAWVSPAYPVPLPGEATTIPAAQRLATYEVVDDLVLPEGFRYDVVAQWGDRLGPPSSADRQIDFGYNNDYTGLVPIDEDTYWLFVNHEYISARPWLEALQEVRGWKPPELRLVDEPGFKYGRFSIDEFVLDDGNVIDLFPGAGSQAVPDHIRAKIVRICEAGLQELGVSVLRVRRRPDGVFEVVREAEDHKRIHGLGAVNVDPAVVADNRFTGPAAALLDTAPRGTFANCSGGTTPWGTFLTCEENFHYESSEQVTPDGRLQSTQKMLFGGENKLINGKLEAEREQPLSLNGLGFGLEEPLDGRHYGWVCEVDPATGLLQKHTALGRFRHENVTVRALAGQRLAAYMGDDRRGGHVWKFVSDLPVDDPAAAETGRLLQQGTLHVARFEDDFSGRWIPLRPETPLRLPEPDACYSSHIVVPDRSLENGLSEGGHIGVGHGKRADLTVAAWQRLIEEFTGKPYGESNLGDLVTAPRTHDAEAAARYTAGVLSMDAFAMANACGGTPTARPEDIEIHPVDGSVYIAFTDATDGSDGAPDGRIFPDSSRQNSRQYGAIFRLVEDDDDPAATTFRWGKFVSSGEVAEQGGGFACADNLVFDPKGNLWMVTDISTTSQNFPNGRDEQTDTLPGGKLFPGVFGNNALFMIPTEGPDAGVPKVFAIAPMESEICGPTFTEDGRTLVLSIQHPGEQHGARAAVGGDEVVTHIVHDPHDQPFEQRRTQPIGSNFPHGERGRSPRPCVVCITRREA